MKDKLIAAVVVTAVVGTGYALTRLVGTACRKAGERFDVRKQVANELMEDAAKVIATQLLEMEECDKFTMKMRTTAALTKVRTSANAKLKTRRDIEPFMDMINQSASELIDSAYKEAAKQ